MNEPHELECSATRAALSARFDGELPDDRELESHLAMCTDCRAFESSLAGLSVGWAALREAVPPATLWARIDARSRPRSARRPTRLALRVAAALVGFVGIGAAGWWLERSATRPVARAHWADGLSPITRAPDTSNLFASVPEYRLLLGSPSTEESR